MTLYSQNHLVENIGRLSYIFGLSACDHDKLESRFTNTYRGYSKRRATRVQQKAMFLVKIQRNKRPWNPSGVGSIMLSIVYSSASKCLKECGGLVQLISTLCLNGVVWKIAGQYREKVINDNREGVFNIFQ